MKHKNICNIGIPKREEKEQSIVNLFEKILTQNFPNMVMEKVMQIQKAQRVPIRMNPKRPNPRHVTIKMVKFKGKERILKATREKQLVTNKGALIRLLTDFSTETLQTRRDWHEIFQVMKREDLKPRFCPARLSFKMEGEIKSCPG